MKSILIASISLLVVAQSTFASEPKEKECSAGPASEANRRFAYEIYKTTATLHPNQNVFLAPTTVGSALAMLLPAARGKTLEQMWQGLMFKNLTTKFEASDIPCLTKAYRNKSVQPIMSQQSHDTSDGDSPTKVLQLKTANRIFGERTFSFDSEFIKETAKYGAEMSKLDFKTNPTASRQYINKWVEDVTEDKIKDLFGEDAITSDTVLAVVSAIYFKGLWKYQFNSDKTTKGMFQVNKERRVEVEYMTLSKKFNTYFESKKLNSQMLELPYQHDAQDGSDVSMILILPSKTSSISETEQKLAEEIIKIENFSPTPMKMEVMLPKFKMSLTYELKRILRKLGIKNLFNPARADLSGMIDPSKRPQNLYVGTAVHKTFIEVDEKGTEAAGATGLAVERFSAVPSFICNRPFLFMIYEKMANNILFIGKVNDPTAEE